MPTLRTLSPPSRPPPVAPLARPARLLPRFGLAAAVLLALLMTCAAPLVGQRVHGTLRDAERDLPLPFGTAELLEVDGTVVVRAVADRGGAFVLVAPAPGRYRIRAWRVGADTLVVGPLVLASGSSFDLDFMLRARPVELEPIDVTVAARVRRLETVGFFERARTGRGRFVTPEMLAERRPGRTTDVLTDLAGLQVDRRGAPFERAPMARTAFERGPDLFCFPAVYVDGVRVQIGGIEPRTIETDLFNFDDVDADHVAGLEVYRTGGDAPAHFPGGDCGVIALWLR